MSDEVHDDFRSLRDAIASREALIQSLRDVVANLEGRMAALESALVNTANENEILKRRLFGPRSERSGTSELQLTLGNLLEEQKQLQKKLDEAVRKSKEGDAAGASCVDGDEPPKKEPPTKPSPKGRRNLAESSLPRVRVDLRDADIEASGGRFIRWETSFELMRQQAAWKVLEKRTAQYEISVAGKKSVLGVEQPPKLLRRSMLHTSTIAWLLVQKFALGVPHHRLEQHLAAQGEHLDRSTMCRNVEEAGNALGATVVHAMFRDALENCSVLSTDATGAAIQPGPRNSGTKQSCKSGHFFTVVADCAHVLFSYAERHSSDSVEKLFHGYKGFLQADASSVYDILDRGPPSSSEQGVVLVGCWAHCRRYFFDAAICKYEVGIQGLLRVRAIYAADSALADLPPVERKRQRLTRVLPLVEDFFSWVSSMAGLTAGRTLATRALGYAQNQEQELRRVFLDGRLPLDNTRSERALRKIVVGRKNWMFYGSDIHAEAAAAVFSLVASCRLHRVDPELYLDEVMRVLPYWPRERFLELAPSRWRTTRAVLDPDELAMPIGPISIPAPPAETPSSPP
jgi:transposase